MKLIQVECWNCGCIVKPDSLGCCPICEVQFPRFILSIRIIDEATTELQHLPHPDPIKRKEAELATSYYEWIQEEFIIDDAIQPSDYTFPEYERPSPPTLPPTPIRQPSPRSITGASRIPDEEKRFDAVYKIVTLGEENSGKTEILDPFVRGKFERDYQQTLGIDVGTYDARIDHHFFKILVWNLAGQDIFRDLRTRYCQGATGGLLFFDCTQPHTLQTLPIWVKGFREAVGPEPHLYLIGTKADKTNERKIQPKAAEKLVKELAVNRYYEIPTTHKEVITDIMNTLALHIFQHHKTLRGTPNL
ncbi:MAG: Rab family GTPase [Promethearchaeota archaeon]